MSTTLLPAGHPKNDQYYWRVSPVDSAGNTLDWVDVDVWEFRRHWPDQPELEYPAHNSLSPVTRSSTSGLRFAMRARTSSRSAPSPDFNPGAMLGTCSTVNTTFTPTVLGDRFPQSLGTYYWRVTAMDGPVGVVSDAISADVYRFTYDPTIVTLSSPSDGASVELPTCGGSPPPGQPSTR